jgi:hypothetical protein
VHELWVLVVAGSNPASPTNASGRLGMADLRGKGTGVPAKALAMVLARDATMADADALRAHLATSRKVRVDHAGETLTAFEVDGEPSMVGLMPAPIPWSQLEGPCATAWWWPEAVSICKPCPAHFVVTTQSSDGDVFAANLRLTAIVAALARAARAPAIYWGAGTLVRSADDFCKQADAASRDVLPLRLWLDFRIEAAGNDDLFFATTGMKAFGLMEIETLAPRKRADFALDRMFNAAHYLCDRGPVLKDGHTFGLSANEKIRISYRRSRWQRSGAVIFLELPRIPTHA